MKYFSLRYLCLVLLGFFFGMFLNFGALIVIMVLAIIIFGTLDHRKTPLDQLLYGVEFRNVLFLSFIVMLVTFYIMTDQTIVQDFFVFIKKLLQTYILR